MGLYGEQGGVSKEFFQLLERELFNLVCREDILKQSLAPLSAGPCFSVAMRAVCSRLCTVAYALDIMHKQPLPGNVLAMKQHWQAFKFCQSTSVACILLIAFLAKLLVSQRTCCLTRHGDLAQPASSS